MRRLISSGEAERLLAAQKLLREIETRCEKAAEDEDLADPEYLARYRALCLGRAAEASLLAKENIFNVLNTLACQCEQSQIEGYVNAPIHDDTV